MLALLLLILSWHFIKLVWVTSYFPIDVIDNFEVALKRQRWLLFWQLEAKVSQWESIMSPIWIAVLLTTKSKTNHHFLVPMNTIMLFGLRIPLKVLSLWVMFVSLSSTNYDISSHHSNCPLIEAPIILVQSFCFLVKVAGILGVGIKSAWYYYNY